jgi:hypothetical protein
MREAAGTLLSRARPSIDESNTQVQLLLPPEIVVAAHEDGALTLAAVSPACLPARSIRTQSLLCWGQQMQTTKQCEVGNATTKLAILWQATRIRVLQASIARVPRANKDPRRSIGSLHNLCDESTLVYTQAWIAAYFFIFFSKWMLVSICFEGGQVRLGKKKLI